MVAHPRRGSRRPSNPSQSPTTAVPAVAILAPRPTKHAPQNGSLVLTGPARGDDAALFHRQSLEALRAQNPRLALDLIAKACAQAGAPGEYHRLHAEILRLCGDLDAALAKARVAVARDGRNARAWDTLAAILAERKDFGESLRSYETAIALDPGLVESRHNLAIVLQLSGRMRDAGIRYREVLERAPDNALARVNYAGLLNTLGRYEEAASTLDAAIAQNPGFADAWLVASSVEYNRERYQPALERIDRAIALAPGQLRMRIRRAEILSRLGRYAEALADCDAVLARFPADAEALRVQAFVLRTVNRPEDALAALRAAQSAAANADVAVDEAWLLAELGRKDDALSVLDRALSERPGLASALYSRAFLARPKPGHPDVAAMERVAADEEAPAKDRMRLAFSLGKIHLDAGDGDKAFSYLDRANALKRAGIAYDGETEERLFAAMMRIFSAENLARHAGEGVRTAQPIFVFGMPRSGTTLVEDSGIASACSGQKAKRPT